MLLAETTLRLKNQFYPKQISMLEYACLREKNKRQKIKMTAINEPLSEITCLLSGPSLDLVDRVALQFCQLFSERNYKIRVASKHTVMSAIDIHKQPFNKCTESKRAKLCVCDTVCHFSFRQTVSVRFERVNEKITSIR